MRHLSLILVAAFALLSFSAQAQESKKSETIEIKTSAQCGMCKKRIETAIYELKGIKSANVDLETQIITVIFKTKNTSADEIRKAISKVGYDADDVPADTKAYENLPKCCQKGGHQ